ncbi:MAG TPA: DUF5947 family protein [Acidimicrobiales bacterium]|nr:DUF5947 family protein [Acidimicrobiales bacterium]
MSDDPLRVLRVIRESPLTTPRPKPGEQCELCGEEIPDAHGHLVDLHARSLMCACRGCYLLFTPDGAGGDHFKAVPERYLAFPDLTLTATQWESLQIPVSVAFFFVNSTLGRVAAFYPSPAGATESLLSLDVWDDIVGDYPALATLLPDVEAILVRADRESGDAEVFLVPIDACYELVGHLRMLWQGFDGGSEAREALELFFAGVRDRAGL